MVFIEFSLVLVEAEKMVSLEIVNQITTIITMQNPILLRVIQMIWSSLEANTKIIWRITCFPTINLRSSRACIQTTTFKKALASLGTIVQLRTVAKKSHQFLLVLAARKLISKPMWRSTHLNALKCKVMDTVNSCRLLPE